MKKTLIIVAVLAVLVAVVVIVKLFVLDQEPEAMTQTQTTQTPQSTERPQSTNSFAPTNFQNIKSPHFVSSNPKNNDLLNKSIDQIVINFNFDLVAPSKISVIRDGKSVTSGDTKITNDNLSLSVPVSANKTGNYAVDYTACWADGSCHEGSFGFSVEL